MNYTEVTLLYLQELYLFDTKIKEKQCIQKVIQCLVKVLHKIHYVLGILYERATETNGSF